MNYKQHRKDHLKELLRERNLSYKELEKPQPACLKCWQSHVVPGSEVASGRRTRLLVWPTELAGHLKLEWDTKTSRCWEIPSSWTGMLATDHTWGDCRSSLVRPSFLTQGRPGRWMTSSWEKIEWPRKGAGCTRRIRIAVYPIHNSSGSMYRIFLWQDKDRGDAEIFLGAFKRRSELK